jgi:D-alanyl-D-alanine carboxypeptidase (penicillin-binding protein 5/6)
MTSRRLLIPALALFFFAAPSSDGATKKRPAPTRPTPKKRSTPPARSVPTVRSSPVQRAAAEGEDGELSLAARGAILLEALTGKALYEKNADTRFYPASTTKIMTGLLIIEAGALETPVEVTEEDARVGESSLSIRPGQTYTRRQMLYGLMLKSANDVAHALGRDNGGTAEAFAAKMTRRAKELGCTNTSFMNAHGLHHPSHYTSPRDLALITRAAMNQPLFRQIVSTQQAPWQAPTGTFMLSNHNRLLQRFPGCNGVKTGYTIPAQQVLASSAVRAGREAIAVVMHTDKPGIWEDSAKLLELGLKQAGTAAVRPQ